MPFLNAPPSLTGARSIIMGDVTRDAAHAPQSPNSGSTFERSSAGHQASPCKFGGWSEPSVSIPCRTGLRAVGMLVISATIQVGMLPLMAHIFTASALSG